MPTIGGLYMPNISGSINEGVEQGRENVRRKTLGDLMFPAMGGDQAALQRIAQVDPEAGYKIHQQQAKTREERTARMAQQLRAAPAQLKPAMYRSFRQSLVADWGDQIPQDYTADLDPVIEQIAGMGGQQDTTPAAIRELQILQANPELAELDMKRRTAGFGRPQWQVDANGNGWWVSPGEAPVPAMGGQQMPYGQVVNTPSGPVRNAGVDAQDMAAVMADVQANGGQDNYSLPPRAVTQREWTQNTPNPYGDATPRVGINFGKAQEAPFQSRQYTPQEVAQIGLPAGTVAYTSESGKPDIVNKPDASSGGMKPIPAKALGEVLNAQDALGATQNVSDIITKHAGRMESGDLQLYPEDAIAARIRTTLGRTDKNDVNVNEFRADMTRIVNESLRLNKGVQTEGDAQRAANELMAANDNKTAARAMQRLAQLNQRAVQLQRLKLRTVYGNYGRGEDGEPLQQQFDQPAAPSSNGWSIRAID